MGWRLRRREPHTWRPMSMPARHACRAHQQVSCVHMFAIVGPWKATRRKRRWSQESSHCLPAHTACRPPAVAAHMSLYRQVSVGRLRRAQRQVVMASLQPDAVCPSAFARNSLSPRLPTPHVRSCLAANERYLLKNSSRRHGSMVATR